MDSNSQKQEQLFVPFTEDLLHEEQCGRSRCGVVIRAGKERHYVLNQRNPEQPGKVVCISCYKNYEQDPSSLRGTCE
jgi:hypothetical protein